jgi:hypothetical protein
MPECAPARSGEMRVDIARAGQGRALIRVSHSSRNNAIKPTLSAEEPT